MLKKYFKLQSDRLIFFVKSFPYFSFSILAIISALLMDCSELFILLFIVPFILFIKFKNEENNVHLDKIETTDFIFKKEIIEIQKDVLDMSYVLNNMTEKGAIKKEDREIILKIEEDINVRIKNFKNNNSFYFED